MASEREPLFICKDCGETIIPRLECKACGWVLEECQHNTELEKVVGEMAKHLEGVGYMNSESVGYIQKAQELIHRYEELTKGAHDE